MPHAQSVSCFVMFAAGSRYETPRVESGIAHFAEHMFFKGTERRPTARDIATEIDSIGGEFNAFTGKELTGYYVKCAAETRDVALDVLVDMLRNSRFDADEIEREKGVIVEEMNMYARHAARYVGNVWERHAVRRPAARLGHHRHARRRSRAATRDTFLGYLDRWYRPERMVVGLGGKLGDGPPRAARGAARLDRARRDRGARRRSCSPRTAARCASTRSSPTRRTSSSARAAIRIGHPDRYAVQLLSTVLGGGMSSRLFTEVRERRGLAYYVYCREQLVHRRRHARGAGRRRPDPDRRGDRRRSSPSCGAPWPSRCRPTSSRRLARSRRAASSSASRARTRRSCSASAASCSRARRSSPTRCSRASTP